MTRHVRVMIIIDAAMKRRRSGARRKMAPVNELPRRRARQVDYGAKRRLATESTPGRWLLP